MNKLKLCSGRASAVAAALALGLFLAARARAGEPELKFEISFPAAVHSNPITGRIFVVVSMSGEREPRLQDGKLFLLLVSALECRPVWNHLDYLHARPALENYWLG